MDKSMVTGIVVGLVAATTGGAIAGFKMLANNEPAYAEVLNVEEITTTVQTPREICEDVPVTREKPIQDPNRVVGTVAGAVLGGVLGNQIGSGTGKKIATVAGAAAGGYAGNKVQEKMQSNNTYTTTERHCHTVNENHKEVIGYNVNYLLGNEKGEVRMDEKPGNRIPVENGQLVLNTSDATTP
jgi:uncharacterized protein YcfJ